MILHIALDDRPRCAYCGGSVQNLVMNIIKSERLSEDELLALKRLAEGDDRKPPSNKRSRK
jgi:hypothetical protein